VHRKAYGVSSRKQASLKEIYKEEVEKNKKRNVTILDELLKSADSHKLDAVFYL